MPAQFTLTSIRKNYGATVAIDLDELVIQPGRLYILAGPNGSGKSTLLHLLAFLVKPDQGDLSFAGERVRWRKDELARLRKKVTLLHQFPYLFTGTVFGNVAFGLKVRGITGAELRRPVSGALAMVGLAGFEKREVGQLSGGEIRRIAMARAIALEPEVLLLDEPLAHVDRESAELLERLIASLSARGTTIIMSTHDPHQGSRLESETIRLQDGRLELVSRAVSSPH